MDDNELEDKDDNCSEQDYDEQKSLNSNSKSNSKSKTKSSRKIIKEMDYDLDDPFIDDSEITDLYQSVFELMRGGHERESDDEEEEGSQNNGNEKNNLVAAPPSRYFVYRGTMTPEIMAKEFEINVNEIEGGSEDEEADELEDGGADTVANGKEDKKRKRKGSTVTNSNKKVKKEKKEKVVKEQKEKAVKEQRASNAKKSVSKPVDLIAQSVKKFNDLYSNEDATTTSIVNSNTKVSNTPMPLDPNLWELRVIIKKFRDLAVGSSFSPGKFPSALRPCLNETICSVLRVNRPTPAIPLPVKLFTALASFLPFSPTALNKLLTKKILVPLLDATEKVELPKLYSTWKRAAESRIKEDGAIVEIGTVPVATSDLENSTINTVTTTTANNTEIPVKRKLKFNDEMRQLIFEILRTEIDLNNLILLTNHLLNGGEGDAVIRSVQSDMNLRRNVYQKLSSMTAEMISEMTAETNITTSAIPLLSTTEISKEFGAQKRRHEKKLSRQASEIVFGEGDVEDFLRELDVKAVIADNAINVENTSNNVAEPQDPLNLFNNEKHINEDRTMTATAEVIDTQNYLQSASNTSLFIDSNQ